MQPEHSIHPSPSAPHSEGPVPLDPPKTLGEGGLPATPESPNDLPFRPFGPFGPFPETPSGNSASPDPNPETVNRSAPSDQSVLADPPPTANGDPSTSTPLLELAETLRSWDTQLHQIGSQSTPAQRNRAISAVLRCAILNAVRANFHDPEALGRMGNLYLKLRKAAPAAENPSVSPDNAEIGNPDLSDESNPSSNTESQSHDSNNADAATTAASSGAPAASSLTPANPLNPSSSESGPLPPGTAQFELAKTVQQCDSAIPQIQTKSTAVSWDQMILTAFHCAILCGLATSFNDLDAIETLGTLFLKLSTLKESDPTTPKLTLDEIFDRAWGCIGTFKHDE